MFGWLRGNPKEITVDTLVLDGQQRITALLLLRQNGKLEFETGYGQASSRYFFYDLEENKFVDTREQSSDAGRFVDIQNILKGNIAARRIRKTFLRRRKLTLRNLKQIVEYEFPVVYTDVRKDEDAIEIFNRVNTSGKKVDKVELAFARLKDRAHNVSKIIAEFQRTWIREGYDLSPRVLINSFLIVKKIKDTENYVRTRNADSQIKKYLEEDPNIEKDLYQVLGKIKDSVGLLKHMGFDSDQFLTTDNAIAVLSGYFERNDTGFYRLSLRKRNSTRKWLFRTLAHGRYSRTTNFLRDLENIRDYCGFRSTPSRSYSQDGLVSLMYGIGRTNHMTDYQGNEITWADTRRAGRVIHVDHIYPHSRMTSEPISGFFGEDKARSLVENIGNKAFAIGTANMSKNKKFPGGKVKGYVGGQWLDGFSLLSDDDYQRMKQHDAVLQRNCRIIQSFIQDREKRIMTDIRAIIK